MAFIEKYTLIVLSWLTIYFYPALEFVLLVGFFVIADTITGIIAAQKNGEEITSKRFRSVFRKYIVYGVAVTVAHVLQRQFFPDFPAMKIIGGMIAYTELMSIDENIKKITGKSLFTFFIKKLGNDNTRNKR